MFTSKDQEEYFEKLLRDAIAKQKKSVRFLRGANYSFTIATLLLSAVLTVILGYNLEDNTYLIYTRNIALVIGAAITFLSGLKAFWKLESFWVRRKITSYKLEDLQTEFNFQKLASEKFDLHDLFSKYQTIRDYSTVYWEDVYNETRNAGRQTPPVNTSSAANESEK